MDLVELAAAVQLCQDKKAVGRGLPSFLHADTATFLDCAENAFQLFFGGRARGAVLRRFAGWWVRGAVCQR